MQIHDFIIHQIEKKKHKPPQVHLRAEVLDAANLHVVKFTELAVDIFKAHEDKPSSVFADFNDDHANYPFSSWCLGYFADNTNFIQFTSDATSRLSHCMEAQQASTGGYVVFATFEIDSLKKLLVVMLHPQDGLSITANLDFEEVTHLDLKHVDKAALISGPLNNSFGPKPLTYAGFRKEMSRYFQEFVGPDAFRDPNKDSHKLIEAFDDYAAASSLEQTAVDTARIQIRNYSQKSSDSKEELDLKVLSAIIDPAKPDAFRVFAADRGISAFIKPDPKVFQKWKVIRFKSKDGLVIQFKSEMVGTPGTSHRLELDEAAKTLTIKNVEEELIQKIRGDLIKH